VGVPLAVAAADPAQRVAAFGSLVQVLARLHAIPLDAALAAGKDILATARDMWDSQRRRPGFPAWAAEAEARLVAACATVATDPRRVFCHMDVNPMNALWDGQRIWLLDWEGAGPGHPYLDLATCSVLLGLSDGVRHLPSSPQSCAHPPSSRFTSDFAPNPAHSRRPSYRGYPDSLNRRHVGEPRSHVAVAHTERWCTISAPCSTQNPPALFCRFS
jgi:hypothetical protein